MKTRRLLLLALSRWICLLGLALIADGAQALCVGPLCSCSVSTTAVTFGSHNPIAAGNTDSTGSVRVTCGGTVGLLIPYKIDLGIGGGASYAARRMASGANTVGYQLYSDSTRLTVWGDGSGGSQSVNSSVLLDALGSAPAQTHTVYGRIPSGQNSAVPGSYTDTITVTVTYY